MIHNGKMKNAFIVFSLVIIVGASAIFLNFQGRAEKPPLLKPGTNFYTPRPIPSESEQIANLNSDSLYGTANLVRKMTAIPHAIWVTGRTPEDARQFVNRTVTEASSQGRVPVLVAYNIPLRDCGQYSAGGAKNAREYKIWIDAFAEGIGTQDAVVILEPDSLGIIPHYVDINGELDWCQPDSAFKLTAPNERFRLLKYAVKTFTELPNVRVYLDATQSRWLSPGDAADRLVKAGIKQADGFALNISNYQTNEDLIKYGTWISKCIWYASTLLSPGYGDYKECASQYSPAKLDDPSTWILTDQWYAENVEKLTFPRYPGDAGLIHFVIDTSRNGQGRWIPPEGKYPDAQDWCNAPKRGLGIRPTSDTKQSLLDAYLWIKIPGDSDGQCTRGLGPAGETVDPEWGRIDPISGEWFPEMALDLARNANPPLR